MARDAARLCACLVVARQPGGEGREAVVPSAGGVHPLARRVLEDERALVTQLLRSPRPHPPSLLQRRSLSRTGDPLPPGIVPFR